MASESQLCWKRVGHVEIENAAGKMVSYSGLDFKFHVKSTGDVYQDFSVSILGLSSQTINDLTVWNVAKDLDKRRKIVVYAGYAQEGESLIAEGYIWYAVPTNPPEMWMNFDCRKYLKLESPVTDYIEIRNSTRKGVFEKVADICKMRLSYRASDADKKASLAIAKGVKKIDLPKAMAKYFGDSVYENCGMLIVNDSNPENGNVSNSKTIDKDNGLLSIGNVDVIGARIVTRLRNDIGLCEWIKLKSILIPSASGDYYVISKDIRGHFRGDEWQTEFRCIRKV